MANVTSPPDADTTFERLPKEPIKAWNAFIRYRDSGPERTLDAVRKALAKRSGYLRQLQEWSGRFDWVKRSRAWDDYIERKARQEMEASIPLWEERRQAALRENIELASKLRDRVREMIEHPLTRERVEVGADGRTMVYVVPNWSWSSVVAMVKCCCDLEAQTIAEGLLDSESDAFDPTTATLDDCRSFISRQKNRTKGRPDND